MLVLSRGRNEKVVFPTLGIQLEILRVDRSRVRIGIDAPKNIPILREELASASVAQALAVSRPEAGGEQLSAVRHCLHQAMLALRVLQRKLDAGQTDGSAAAIVDIIHELKSVDAELPPAIEVSRPARSAIGPVACRSTRPPQGWTGNAGRRGATGCCTLKFSKPA